MNDTLIRFETVDGVCVATVATEIDLANADVLERYLTEASAHCSGMIVSLTKCNYIDSSGLRALAHVAEQCRDDLAVVVSPLGQVRRVFEIAGFGARLRICTSLSQALFAMRRQVPA